MLPEFSSSISAKDLVDSFPHGYLVVGADNEIVQWNLWLVRKTGIEAEDAIGKRLEDIYPERSKINKVLKYVRSLNQPYLCSQKIHQYFLPIALPEGHISGHSHMLQESQIVPLKKGELISITIRDVTSVAIGEKRMKLLQNELGAAKEKAQVANQAKSAFLANMSHELRTPLNSLLILSQMLANNDEGNMTEDQVESLEMIYDSGHDLLSLINDILDLSKVEAGEMTVRLEDVNLHKIIDKLQRQFSPLLNEKKLSLSVTYESFFDSSIYTDSQHLEHILKNLISNAIKFTKQGGITLKIQGPDRLKALGVDRLDGRAQLAISVCDTGVGIPEEHQTSIFEPFKQADSSTSRVYGGTGLGLSISQEMARLIQGEIGLTSMPGEGSEFTLYLAAKNPEEAAKPQEEDSPKGSHAPQQSESTPSKEPHVFIVDDDLTTFKALSVILKARGLKTDNAFEHDTIIQKLRANRYDCMTIDMGLKGTTGLEMLRVLKEIPEIKRPPTLFYTAADLSDEIRTELSSMVDSIIIKGSGSGKELIQRICDLVQEPDKKKASSEKEKASPTGFTALKMANQELWDKRLLLVDDEVRNTFALSKLLKRHGLQVTIAHNGIDALEKLDSEPAFDIVLMDIMIPEMDGYTAIKEIRKRPEFKTLPVIAVTAKAMAEDCEQCLECGADEYLSKPVCTEKLLGVMKKCLSPKAAFASK